MDKYLERNVKLIYFFVGPGKSLFILWYMAGEFLQESPKNGNGKLLN
jgi:hypothetical protein